jgi:hypothetical protein
MKHARISWKQTRASEKQWDKVSRQRAEHPDYRQVADAVQLTRIFGHVVRASTVNATLVILPLTADSYSLMKYCFLSYGRRRRRAVIAESILM